MGVGAFFFAGLLPDADEPYKPAIWNANTWVVSLGFECTLLALGIRGLLGGSSRHTALDAVNLALSILRTFVLAGMIIIFWLPRTLDSGTPDSTSEETERLLPSGASNGAPAYGTASARERLLNGPVAVRSGDAQTTDWTDYVAGFAKLFPFLWLVQLNHADQAESQVTDLFLLCYGKAI